MDKELSCHDKNILDQIFSTNNNDDDVQQNVKISNRPLQGDAEMEAAKIELKAINIAEGEKDYEQALLLIDEAIKIAPRYPSLYNNRAQLLNLINSDPTNELNKAIILSDEENFPLVKRNALLQRAWYKYVKGESEEAFHDFSEAAKLGSTEGKKMAVRCNPYARLCNNIMQEMLQSIYYSKSE